MNEYNHITATYFLLAERRLHAQRHELAKRLRLRAAKREQMEAAAAAAEATGGEQQKGDSAAKDTKDGITRDAESVER